MLGDGTGYTVGEDEVYFWDGENWTLDKNFEDASISFRGVAYIAFNLLYIVSRDWLDGGIYKWDGFGYTKVFAAERYGCSSIYAFSSDNIFAGCDGEIVRWKGDIWRSISLDADEITGLSFVSDQNGYAIDERGKVFHWNGFGWSLFSEAVLSNAAGILAFSSSDIWLLGRRFDPDKSATGVIWTYEEESWVPKVFWSNTFYSIDGVTPTDIWFGGSLGEIDHFGENGFELDLASATAERIRGIHMIDRDNGWAVGDNGVILMFTGEK